MATFEDYLKQIAPNRSPLADAFLPGSTGGLGTYGGTPSPTIDVPIYGPGGVPYPTPSNPKLPKYTDTPAMVDVPAWLGGNLLRLVLLILGLICVIGAIYLFKDTRPLVTGAIGAVKKAAEVSAA